MGRAATRKDHEAFWQIEGWVQVRGPRGKKVSHHVTYEFPLSDGRVLRTRISRPVGKDTYGPAMWGHILRDQLAVSDEQFWACVNHKVLPNRGEPPAVPANALPAGLVYQLIAAGVSRDDISRMDKESAVRRLEQLRGAPPSP